MTHSLSRFALADTVVSVDSTGAISAVEHAGQPLSSYLSLGLPTDPAIDWVRTDLAVDTDEVESTRADASGLGITVRHTFVAGWQVRCVLANSGKLPRSVRLQIPLEVGPECVASAVAEGSEAELLVQPEHGRGPILAGRLRRGSIDRIGERALISSPLTLEPGSRFVLSWEWGWLPSASAYVRKRPTIHPLATIVVRGAVVSVPGGPDVALVMADDLAVERGDPDSYELSAADPVGTQIELRSARGVRRLGLAWTPTPAELLRQVATDLLAAPRGPVGVVVLAGLAAALTVQWALATEALDARDDAGDALDLFTARLDATDSDRALAALYLCGEYERSGDHDLLEAATRQVLDARQPKWGLGLAATRICLARVALGLSARPITDQLMVLASSLDAEANEIRRFATAAELLAVTRSADPVSRTSGSPAEDALFGLVARLGAELGAGLPGHPVRPLPVEELGHVLIVLRLLPDALAEPTRRMWGVSAADVAERLTPTLIARLVGRDVSPAHVWLTMLVGGD